MGAHGLVSLLFPKGLNHLERSWKGKGEREKGNPLHPLASPMLLLGPIA